RNKKKKNTGCSRWRRQGKTERGRQRKKKIMGLCFDCFGGGNNHMTKEEQRLASEEARARAAEAAQKRQEEYEKSAAGRAARAQIQGMQKQSANSNKGEPALKWQMG
ncbi:Histone H4 transcription factor, partial [Quillaja saponaria]